MTATSIHGIQLVEAHSFSLWGLLTAALQQITEPYSRRENTMKLYRVALFLFFFPVVAQATSEAPIDLIRTATERVLAKLDTDPEIKTNPDRLFVLIEENMAPNIDFRRLSRLAIGKHWRMASIDQKQRFTGEFKQLLIRIYSTTLAEYSGQGVTYRALNTKTDGKRAVVRATVERSGGPSIDIDYSLYQTTSGWKIYDMKVEGISLVVNYRSSFNREIRANGMDGLIEHLAMLNR